MFFLPWRDSSSGPRLLHYRGLMITLRHTTHGRTPLGEWSAGRRDLYLTTHNTQKRQTSMTPEGFEPTIPASERPQTHTLDCTATGIGILQWLGLDKSRVEFLKGKYKTWYSARCEKNFRSGRVEIVADTMELCVARYSTFQINSYELLRRLSVKHNVAFLCIHGVSVFVLRVLCDRWTVEQVESGLRSQPVHGTATYRVWWYRMLYNTILTSWRRVHNARNM